LVTIEKQKQVDEEKELIRCEVEKYKKEKELIEQILKKKEQMEIELK
jgi:hypothetical protein